MNEVIEMPRRESAGLVAAEVNRYSVSEILGRVKLVQEVMGAVMKENVHYGKIPGTPKPTLYKAGAEVLCVAFRIAPSYRVEDLSDATTARFRVTCIGTHQVSGIVLGEGMGECSSAEEKYKWRGAVCAEEFDMYPETMRRLKFSKYQNNVQKKTQVRTEAADVSNTVLKMACKRAKMAMTLDVTAASDMFNQDLEDLDEALRDSLTNADHGEPAMTALATEWVGKAHAAKTADELSTVWTDGVKAINTAKDAVAQAAFRQAVTERGTALKAPADQPKPQTSASAGLLADLEAAADCGPAEFEQSWSSLSMASQELMQPHLEALAARAAAKVSQ